MSALAGFLRSSLSYGASNTLVCQIRSFNACAMKHQRHFETTASREAAKTKTLIADLDRIVQIIKIEIATQEEEEAGGFDRFQAQYPMRARELTERRDKLTDTITVLEQYLGRLK
jgi:hypothetical protein